MADLASYRDQREWLRDELRGIRVRLRAARDYFRAPPAAPDPLTWPVELTAIESEIDGRLGLSGSPTLPLDRLRESFELSATEQRLLWVLIAHELCPISRGLIRDLNSEHLADPTTDTLRRCIYGSELGELVAWRELSDDGPLRRFGLIERTDGSSDAPFHRQTWKASDRVLALAHGDLSFDPRLARLASVVRASAVAEHIEVADGALSKIRAACANDNIVIVHGPVGSGRRTTLIAALAAAGKSAVQIDARSISKDPDVAAREMRGLARECAILGLTPLIRDFDALAASGDIADRVALVEAELRGLVVATASRPIPRRWQRATISIELLPIATAQRATLWQRAIPSLDPDRSAALATLYPLAPALIHAAGKLAVRQFGSSPVQIEHIGASLRSILDDRLAGLAKRVASTQTWDDVVLPEDQLTALVELMARIRQRATVYETWGFAAKVGRGLGVSALFSGPPGTGKTMTAGLIAKDLGVELYQVDISKIVSKWIGETEKNLASLFDAAEAGHAILLFDEADSLFGKRTDVRSSNDRYANQEVNFLLQRLESYTGIVILTTNHEMAIDDAFRRRLSLHVQFPMPETEERGKLWRALIPRTAPTSGNLRLEKLAEQFEMSGGYIRNAVVRAAFLAAAENTTISAGHLMKAAHLEYEAMGKITSRI